MNKAEMSPETSTSREKSDITVYGYYTSFGGIGGGYSFLWEGGKCDFPYTENWSKIVAERSAAEELERRGYSPKFVWGDVVYFDHEPTFIPDGVEINSDGQLGIGTEDAGGVINLRDLVTSSDD